MIIEGLNGILSDIENGTLHFDPNAEDIHMFVEAELTARIGDGLPQDGPAGRGGRRDLLSPDVPL